MREQLNFYIGGKWVAPAKPRTHDVINPANEEPVGRVSLGAGADVDKAVAAARAAFETWSRSTIDERKALLWNASREQLTCEHARTRPEFDDGRRGGRNFGGDHLCERSA